MDRAELRVELWPVEGPVPYAKNPRVISAEAINKVAASIKKFGFRQPIVVDRKRVIVVGHAPRLAPMQLGLKRVPVHVANDLSEKRARAYRLADNRSNEGSSWNRELLAVELTDLGEAAGDLTGFDPAEIAELFGGETDLADPPAQLDKARELQAKWGTAPLQAWAIGPHRLVPGDCREKTVVGGLWRNGGPKLRLVWTDAPYGVSYAGCSPSAQVGQIGVIEEQKVFGSS